jgi:hypothetical protein
MVTVLLQLHPLFRFNNESPELEVAMKMVEFELLKDKK